MKIELQRLAIDGNVLLLDGKPIRNVKNYKLEQKENEPAELTITIYVTTARNDF